MRAALAAGAALAGIALGADAASAQAVAIINARIHPVSGPVIERGTIIMQDGRITAVGADVERPAGVRLIDAAGKVVTPGFLDSFTRLGVVEINAVEGTEDSSSDDDRVTAAFRVSFGLNPASTLLPIARSGGITRAVVAPGGGSPPKLIHGQGALIDLGGGRVEDMVHRDPVAMFASIDEGTTESVGGARGVAMLRLREALEDARDYAANRSAYDAGQRREYALSRLDLEALGPVLRGELPLALAVDRAADIRQALRLGEEYGLRLILVGAAEGWGVAEDIAAAGVPVVVDPMANIPGYDALATTLENAARLAAAGVDVVFATFDAHNVRNLRQAAGNAVANGMPYESALRAVTAAPAALWGVADTYGTLEPGRTADVVVWSGDPFELLSTPEHVFVEGREVSLDSRQQELLERYRRIAEDGLPQSYRH